MGLTKTYLIRYNFDELILYTSLIKTYKGDEMIPIPLCVQVIAIVAAAITAKEVLSEDK